MLVYIYKQHLYNLTRGTEMKLHGIDFGNVLGASGVQGFFGEGYWFHHFPLIGPDFTGMTFVSKTATLNPRKGNMPLTGDFKPKHWFPSCVKVQWNGNMLNAVGLSNPGLLALLKINKWQKRMEPFLISIMSVEDTPEKRIDELCRMVDIIGEFKKDFFAPFGLQINLSCPNTGHNSTELINESAKVLEVASSLGVSIMLKYSIASAPIMAIMQLNENPACDAICVSNTLPFGWEGIDWKKVWGSDTSPLAHLGGGGLSGKALRPLVCNWIKRLRAKGFNKPINGGGGILCPADVNEYHRAGANSIFVGSTAVLRPKQVQNIVRQADNLNWR